MILSSNEKGVEKAGDLTTQAKYKWVNGENGFL